MIVPPGDVDAQRPRPVHRVREGAGGLTNEDRTVGAPVFRRIEKLPKRKAEFLVLGRVYRGNFPEPSVSGGDGGFVDGVEVSHVRLYPDSPPHGMA